MSNSENSWWGKVLNTISQVFSSSVTETSYPRSQESNSDINKIEEKVVQNRSEHKNVLNRWWENPVTPITDSPEFEPIQEEKLISDLLLKVARKNFHLIEIPAHITQAIQLLEQDSTTYDQIAALIEQSPGVMGEFVRVANSAQYFRGRNITDIRVILSRLGRRNSRSLLYLCVSRLSLPSHPFLTGVAEKIIEHSLVTGRIAEYLSQRYYGNPSEAFVSGLLHDVGKLAILREIGEEMDLPPELENYSPDERMFCRIFPPLHVSAGGIIAEDWKLPKPVLEVITHHHDENPAELEVEPDVQDLVALVQIANQSAKILGFGAPIAGFDLFSCPAALTLQITEDPDTCDFLAGVMNLFEEVEST